ncbi:MAG: SusD/RagB family nutrient-binding outer membrane lipoprotein [Reichenbachiella sp.]|uniref:SusD/RagB family nutrient-binding outer membrane lipoprotein n=1 Tax=Reichenbachiella sp. TaxID=2184521 RepID=UPI003263C999
MKKFINISLAIAMIFMASCEDYLDVNTDPNNPTDATAGLVFPAATLSVVSVIGGDYALTGNIWSQYWTQNHAANQYKAIDGYNLISTFQGARFQELYAGALNDLRFVKEKATVDEDWSYYLMATVLEAYSFQILADLYDDVPFDEALQGGEGNFSPAYVNGQVIYDSLIVRLDNALAKDLSAITVTNPGTADLIFGGNMAEWVKFANTLKLKIYMRQTESRASVAQAGIDALYASNAEFLDASAAVTSFADQANASNPLFEQDRRQLNTANNLKASTTMVDYLTNNGDPRINSLYEVPANGGLITGQRQGDYELSTLDLDPDDVSRAIVTATDPVYFISDVESLFLQAEAAARGYGTGDAKTLYDAAVNASFSMYGEDASTFIAAAGLYEYPNGTLAQNIEAIIMQKWVANARINGLEAWFDHLRTGFPLESTSATTFVSGQLNYPVNGVTSGQYPRRYLYPDREVSRNANTPTQKDIHTAVWWDQ